MANRRLSMRKIKEVLRLKYEAGLSNRAIARSCGICHKTVKEYLSRARASGLSWPLDEALDEEALGRLLFPKDPSSGGRVEMPDMAWVHRELKKKGVTRKLLWQEFSQGSERPCSYSRFCQAYKEWSKGADPVMRQEHKAGEKVFVDYAGLKMDIVDPCTGESMSIPVFVAVLGASSYIYAEATEKGDLEGFIGAHTRAFEYFGGVPEVVVPDNLKAGVKSPSRYEPDINPTYQEMARHYGVAVIPARVRRPRDKAKVEVGVQLVERWIMAALRNRTFFSVGELNSAMSRLLKELNERPLKGIGLSRRELFEGIEKPALRPLPTEPYTFSLWKMAKVGFDYHIQVEGHYYSVPYHLIGKKVNVRISRDQVEVYCGGKRVAAHLRSRVKGAHTTCEEHMPEGHRLYRKSPRDLIEEAMGIGPQVGELAEAIMEAKEHPIQGYRSIMGIIRLAKAYPKDRMEAACARALAVKGYSYRSVKSILEKGLDRLPPMRHEILPSIEHHNIRGASYYQEDKGCS